MITTFTTINDLRNWVDRATTNWDERTDEQTDQIADAIRAMPNFPAWGTYDISDFLETLPENLLDLIETESDNEE